MMAAMFSILVCLASGVSLTLILVVFSGFLAEEPFTLKSLWAIGAIPVAVAYGAAVSVAISPLMIWAFRDWSDPQAIRRGLILWCGLAFYFVIASVVMTGLQLPDTYAIGSFLIPLALSIFGLVSIGRSSR